MVSRTSRSDGGEIAGALLRLGDRSGRGLDGVSRRPGLAQLAIRCRGQREKLLVGPRSEASLEVGELLEASFDRLEGAGLRVERGEEAVEIRSCLTQPDRELAQLLGAGAELGCDALERGERPLGQRRQRGSAFAFVGRDRRNRCGRRLGELLDMPEPLALGEQARLLVGSHPLGRLDERLQLCKPECDCIRVTGEIVIAPTCCDERGPCDARIAAPDELLLPAERVEDVELEGLTRKPTLLELTRHGDQPLRRRRDVLARDGSAPRVCAGAPVAEDAARDHETGLALRSELRERRHVVLLEEPVRYVEFRFDVRLGSGRTDRRGISARTQEEPDGLGEDRLPRARLSGHGIQTGTEPELGLADEDEVLDPQATKHESRADSNRQEPPFRSLMRILRRVQRQEPSATDRKT